MTYALIALYVSGAVAELVGLLVVAADIRHAESRASEIRGQEVAPIHGGTIRGGSSYNKMPRGRELPWLRQRVEELNRQVRAVTRNHEIAVRQVQDNVIDALAGNLGRRRWGLYALVLGLVLSVVGNILSALR